MTNLDLDLELLFTIGASFEALYVDRISPEVVVDPMVKEVYEWALTYFDKYNEAPPVPILEHEFLKYNLSFEAPSTQVDDLLTRLRDRYIRNQAQKTVVELGKAAVREPQGLAQRLMSEGRRLDRVLTSSKDVFDAGSLDQALLSYHKRVAKGRGPSIAFPEVDDHFDGLDALTFLVGSPKSLKSWLTVKSALANILLGHTVYISTLEMPKEVYIWRIYCMAANIPFWKYLKRALEPEDEIAIKKAAGKLKDSGDFYIEKAPNGERSAQLIFSRAKTLNADIIYIDQLQYVENSKGVAIGAINKTEDFFEVCNTLKDLAEEKPIWVAHQFNRSVMGNTDFPEMQQIKNSSAIEETATLALALHSNRAMRQDNIVQFGTLASRNYGLPIWEIKTEMKKGCSLTLIDRVDI